MSDAILQTFDLGFQWPTADPFLFCVHHLDRYPAANDQHGPAADLAGRELGADFQPLDGWRMYHGQTVPGFPVHPHRGFETITFVRRGLVDHADSLGARARYGRGDVQWLTAGGGIQHAEMFPLLDRDGDNTLELFQIWLNLPAADKMVDAHFTMFWDADIPRLEADGVTVTVIAGSLADADRPPCPPPASWASNADADVAVWHVVMEAGSDWELPAAAADDTSRVLYFFDGTGLLVDGTSIDDSTGVVVDPTRDVTLSASGHVEVLVLQGRALREPVVQHGPFVMNTKAEINKAFDDYQRTQFGGWPWERPDPVHGDDPQRFAQHADGTIEHAPTP